MTDVNATESIELNHSPLAVLTSGGHRELGRIDVRVVRSARLLDELNQKRRETYRALGVVLHNDALTAQKKLGTTLGVFVDEQLLGAFSA